MLVSSRANVARVQRGLALRGISVGSSQLQDIAPDMAERGGEEGTKEQMKQARHEAAECAKSSAGTARQVQG